MGKRKIPHRESWWDAPAAKPKGSPAGLSGQPEPPWLKIIGAILAWLAIVWLVGWLVSSGAKAQPPPTIELHIKACYKPDPRVCVNHRLEFMQDGLTVYACMMRAQPELAKWAQAHPGWYVVRYRCGKAGVFAKA